MNNRHCINLASTVATAVVLLAALSSCERTDIAPGGQGVVTLSVSDRAPDTRAELYDGSDLKTSSPGTEGIGIIAMDASSSSVLIDGEKATYNGSVGHQQWEGTTQHEFTFKKLNYAAYYPYSLTVVTSTVSTTNSVSFSYTVPADAADQKDVMVGYNDNGGNGYLWLGGDAVSLVLRHAMSAIKFVYGDISGAGASASTVTIKSVYATQTCTATFGASQSVTFGWTDNASSCNVSGNIPNTTPTTGVSLGVTFALIPQDFGVTPPTLDVSFQDGSTATGTFPSPLAWEAGKTYTYTLDFEQTGIVITNTDVSVGDLTENNGTLDFN